MKSRLLSGYVRTIYVPAEGLQVIHTLFPEEPHREGGFVVVERFIQPGIETAGLPVGGTRDGGKFGQHHPGPLGGSKADRRFQVLRLRFRMTDDDVCGNRSSASVAQHTDRITELFGIDLATRLFLPVVGTRFESQEKCLKTRSDHEARNFRRYEARIQSIGCMK